MAKDVYRIVTAEGHEYDYHGTVEQLKEAHPGAQITGRRVVNSVGEGSYEPYTIPKARAAERKEAAAEGATPTTSGAPAKVTVKTAAASKKGETAP